MEYKWINPKEISDIEGQKLILFGAGAGCEEFLHYHKEKGPDSQIIAVTDNDPSYWGQKLYHYDIITPARLTDMQFDKIIVTTISGREAISAQLENMGFKHHYDYILIGRYPQTYIGNIKRFLGDIDGNFLLKGAHCLHIGPGGFLGLEILLYSLGAEKVYSIDNLPFDIRFPQISGLEEDYDGVKETLIDIVGDDQSAHYAFDRYEDVFIQKRDRIYIDENKVEYRHPMDMCNMTYKDNSFDLVISFSVLEHVLEPEAAVSEAARCLKPGGICYHTVVTQDHRSFSKVGNNGPFAYRQYNPEEWDRIATNRFYQNRLLPLEWKRLHEKNRFSIQTYYVENRFGLNDETVDNFHSDFKCFSKQELCEADCLIVVQKEAI